MEHGTRDPEHMPKINANGVPIYYRSLGHGYPVVLIHGLGGDHTSWEGPIQTSLSPRHRLVLVDLRGHGRSGRTAATYTTDLFARDVQALLVHLRIGQASVIGISMGGAVAMAMAAAAPRLVRKLVLVDTWIRCDEAARASFLEWSEASRESRSVLQKIVLIRTATPEFVAANPDFIRLFRHNWPTNHGPAFRKSVHACVEHDATPYLAKIEAPTLVMVGDRDILVPPPLSRQLTRQVRGARLVTVQGGGHVPWLDRPEACVRVLKRFLQ